MGARVSLPFRPAHDGLRFRHDDDTIIFRDTDKQTWQFSLPTFDLSAEDAEVLIRLVTGTVYHAGREGSGEEAEITPGPSELGSPAARKRLETALQVWRRWRGID